MNYPRRLKRTLKEETMRQFYCQDDNHEGPSRVHSCYDNAGVYNTCLTCKKEKCPVPDGMIGKTCTACIVKQNNLIPVKEK